MQTEKGVVSKNKGICALVHAIPCERKLPFYAKLFFDEIILKEQAIGILIMLPQSAGRMENISWGTVFPARLHVRQAKSQISAE